MAKKVYVLTEEREHCVVGVYSHYEAAATAMLNRAKGCAVVGTKTEWVGTLYKFVNQFDHNDCYEYYIEKVIMDDPLWLNDMKEEEGE